MSFNIAFYRCRNCGPRIYTRAKLSLTQSHLLCHKPSWHIICKRQGHESRDENEYAQRKEVRTWGYTNIQVFFFLDVFSTRNKNISNNLSVIISTFERKKYESSKTHGTIIADSAKEFTETEPVSSSPTNMLFCFLSLDSGGIS